MTILIKAKAGTFAENKDVARDLRLDKIMPALAKGQKVTLDFAEVTGATQSFVHALISEAIREYGDDVYDSLYFKNCNDTVKEIVNIVAEYMQES
jgi:hypothetical protein